MTARWSDLYRSVFVLFSVPVVTLALLGGCTSVNKNNEVNQGDFAAIEKVE